MGSSGNNRWEFFDSGYRTAQHNMAVDMQLVDDCRESGTSYLRFYRWKPYAISLGYNQNKVNNALYIDAKKCHEDNIDIVTRPTGGRAVLHSQELTYSVVMQSELPVHVLYKEISLAIINGLKTMDEKFKGLSFANETPDLVKLMKTGMYNLCFNSTVKNEINYAGRKLVGSAQRKFGSIVLQHGSLLIGPHHKSIVKYLNLNDVLLSRMSNELEEKTVCLNEIAEKELSYKEVSLAVFKGFKNTFNIDFKHINRVPDFVNERLEPSYVYN